MSRLLKLVFGWLEIYRRRRASRKLARDDLCRCGSGKKYKRCCLPIDQQRGLSEAWSASNREPEVLGGASAAERG